MRTDREKIRYPQDGRHDGVAKYPWVFLPYAPRRTCFFDAWHGVVGYDHVPFALTTRAMLSDTQFLLELYEDGLVWE